MPRKREAKKRDVIPDFKFESALVAKLINHLMLDGKKSVAERIVYSALSTVAEKIKAAANKEKEDGEFGTSTTSARLDVTRCSLPELLDFILDNIRPTVEVRSRRVGGATYQVPVEVRPERRDALAMRWIISAARNRGEKGMELRLSGELFEAYAGRGSAVKKKEDVHKMARANQAFAHFRWN